MDSICYKAVGKILSPFKEPEGTPIQPSAKGAGKGKIVLYEEYIEALKDLEEFSHLFLLYHCHKAGKAVLTAKPFMEDKEHGIFAIRAPRRPNSIGLSVVELEKIEDNIIYIKDVDILDQTPLLDIKPYVPEFDMREDAKIGWLEKNVKKVSLIKDDGRFAK